ncbi:MAG: hypothetical protein M1834_003087 [Cirrosporium novae-zelandiae]|nr:MAG: hypothetical protein M1834_003087 [Cirrosporium novae-zelandiae]
MAAAVATPLSSESIAAHDYLKARLASHPASSINSSSFQIPVIDISPSYSNSIADRQAVASQIRSACLNSGFFQIVNHGIDQQACDGILEQARRFFHELPIEKREKLHIKYSGFFRGWEPADSTSLYADEGEEGAGGETKDGFNWGYEERLDPTGGDGKYVEVDGSQGNKNVWPKEEDLPGFFEGIKEYYSKALQLARHLFRVFALALNLPESYFDSKMTHPGGIARLIHYPPQVPQQETTKEIGLNAHSDYECFTILLCSSAPGLEVLSPTNEWVSVVPAKGALVVNVADFLMRWTNGQFKSTVHRVVSKTERERYSVPLFFSINYDEKIETLPSCTSDDNPSKYPPITAGQYVLDRLRATLKE